MSSHELTGAPSPALIRGHSHEALQSTPARGPRLRRPIAVSLSRFPLITETFILREVEELERQGQPVVLAPLVRERPQVIHREAEPWLRRGLFTPLVSARIAQTNLEAMRAQSRAYLGLLLRLLRGTARRPAVLARTLALFPKSVELARLLAELEVRHIHAHFATYPATMAYIVSTLRPEITYSLTVHAHDIFVDRTFLAEKLRRAELVRAISDLNRRYLLEHVPGLDADRIRVIHVGVDPEPYGRLPPPPLADEGGEPLVLCIAALKPYKGVVVLLEACARWRDARRRFRCVVVGQGPLRAELEAQARRLGLGERVRFLGARPQDEVRALLGEASVVVQPSVVAPDGQMEGIPVSLMEALAARRPVVASRLSGIPELIRDGETGLLVEPNDAAALAARLEEVLANPDLARRLGEAGRRTVMQDFHLRRCVEALAEEIDAMSPPPPGDEVTDSLRRAPWPGSVGLRRRHASPDSRVVELLVPTAGTAREVVLKLHVARAGESRSPVARARRERDTLAALARFFEQGQASAPRFAVPRPLDLDVEPAGVCMEASRGERLDLLVRRLRLAPAWRHRERLLAALRGAGAWLGKFQQWRPEWLALQAASPSAVPRHGDFWPGNIFVAADAVEVIDFEGVTAGHPYEDLAYFLVHLELFLAHPLLRRRRRGLRAAFLDGFFGPRPVDAAALARFRTVVAQQLLNGENADQLSGRRRRWLCRVAREAVAPGSEAS